MPFNLMVLNIPKKEKNFLFESKTNKLKQSEYYFWRIKHKCCNIYEEFELDTE